MLDLSSIRFNIVSDTLGESGSRMFCDIVMYVCAFLCSCVSPMNHLHVCLLNVVSRLGGLCGIGFLTFGFTLFVSPQANRGGHGGGIHKVVTLFTLIILMAYTWPSALKAIFTAQTSGWLAVGQSLWPVLGLMGEVAALVLIIYSAL